MGELGKVHFGELGNSPLPWRQGRWVGRTIYDANDEMIGVMDTTEDAELVVVTVNGWWAEEQ